MTDTDQNKEDEVLKRMLATKPKPHKEKADEKSPHSHNPMRSKPARSSD